MSEIDMSPDLRNLYYRIGHELKMDPVNITLTNAAQMLLDGQTVHIVLEPGDATLYDFYLIPMWGAGMRPRYLNEEDAMKYVLLCQKNLEQRTTLVPFVRDEAPVYYGVTETISQHWTGQLLSCFMLKLADESYEQAARKQAAFQRVAEHNAAELPQYPGENTDTLYE